jgi:hypothetical protein
LQYSLKSLDKLDKAEAKEKEEKEVQEHTTTFLLYIASTDVSWLKLLSDKQLYQLLADVPEGTVKQQPLY